MIVLPEWLEIGGQPWATRAIVHVDLLPLRAVATRGSNTPIPGIAGVVPNPRRTTEIDAVVEWRVRGSWTPNGAEHPDPVAGLDANLDYYAGLLFAAVDPATGLTAAKYHLADGRVYKTELQPVAWDAQRTGPASASVLTRLIIPSGAWTEVEESP